MGASKDDDLRIGGCINRGRFESRAIPLIKSIVCYTVDGDSRGNGIDGADIEGDLIWIHEVSNIASVGLQIDPGVVVGGVEVSIWVV